MVYLAYKPIIILKFHRKMAKGQEWTINSKQRKLKRNTDEKNDQFCYYSDKQQREN